MSHRHIWTCRQRIRCTVKTPATWWDEAVNLPYKSALFLWNLNCHHNLAFFRPVFKKTMS
jgi:hypothetical protein